MSRHQPSRSTGCAVHARAAAGGSPVRASAAPVDILPPAGAAL